MPFRSGSEREGIGAFAAQGFCVELPLQGDQGQWGKKQEEQRQPGQDTWKQPGQTPEEKKPEKREDVA